MAATAAVPVPASARVAAMAAQAVLAVQEYTKMMMIKKRQQAMLAAMARTVVQLPRWVRSIYMMAPRLSLPRQIFMEATKVPVGAMVAPEAYTL